MMNMVPKNTALTKRLNRINTVVIYAKNNGWEVFRIAKTWFFFKNNVEIIAKPNNVKYMFEYSHYHPNWDVITELNHPKKGRTKLLRKIKNIKGLINILYYPRIHSGKGRIISKC